MEVTHLKMKMKVTWHNGCAGSFSNNERLNILLSYHKILLLLLLIIDLLHLLLTINQNNRVFMYYLMFKRSYNIVLFY